MLCDATCYCYVLQVKTEAAVVATAAAVAVRALSTGVQRNATISHLQRVGKIMILKNKLKNQTFSLI